MTVILNKAKPTRCPAGQVNVNKLTRTRYDIPRIAVKAHDDTFDPSTILGCCALGEEFIYLFLSGVEAQVADLCTQVSLKIEP